MESVSNVLKFVLYRVLTIGCCLCFIGQLRAEESVEIEKKSGAAIQHFIRCYQGGRFTYMFHGNIFHLPYPDSTDFGVWVTAKTQESIKSGRILALTFLQAYFEELQHNKDTQRCYKDNCDTFPKLYSGKLSLKHVAVRIAFWDENVDRPKAPFLSEIDFYQDKFRYYEADPKTQALKLVLEESYSDAVKQLEATQTTANKDGL